MTIQLDTMTADMILKIPATEPERLFTGEAGAAKREYHKLAQIWHPDHQADARARDVFEHLTALFAKAKEQLAAGTWRIPGERLFADDATGKTYRLRFKKQRRFEIGETYIGNKAIAFEIDADQADLAAEAEVLIKALRYQDDKMNAAFQHLVPEITKSFTSAGKHVLIIRKEEDFFPVGDVQAHLGKPFEPVHVAWIVNTALNLACLLAFNGIAHQAIGPDTFFINARRHAGALLGGWFYARPIGAALKALPGDTVATMPADLLTAKKADFRTDLDLIRRLGRSLLGDATGTKLARDKDLPKPMVDWLRHASAGKAVEDYASWEDALTKSFGKRHFHELKFNPNDLYQ